MSEFGSKAGPAIPRAKFLNFNNRRLTEEKKRAFDKIYASVGAIQKLRKSLLGVSAAELQSANPAEYEDPDLQRIEERRRILRKQTRKPSKIVSTYYDRFLFAENGGRTLRPGRNRRTISDSLKGDDVQDLKKELISADSDNVTHDEDEILQFARSLHTLANNRHIVEEVSENGVTDQLSELNLARTNQESQDNSEPDYYGQCDSPENFLTASATSSSAEYIYKVPTQRHGPFSYEPLADGCFRLIVLLPGKFEEEVHCQSVPVRKETATFKYETLSYCWRTTNWSQNSARIQCNGRYLLVTANLHAALCYLRYHDRPRVLWIDALCINQSDSAERSRQVRNMDSIYAHSFRTLVWLGTTQEEIARAALGSICKLVNEWHGDQIAEYQTQTGFGKHPPAEESTTITSDGQSVSWDALSELFNCRWFSRRWVIQEIVNSKSIQVLWGSSTIPWQWIGIATAILRTQYHQKISEFANSGAQGVYNGYLMFRLRRNGNLQPLKLSFLQLLRLTENFQTTEQLDKFYALLGIRTTDNIPGERPFLDIEYGDYFKTCIRVVEKFMEDDRPLSFLSQLPMGRYLSNYSWLPPWDLLSPPILMPWHIDRLPQRKSTLPFKKHQVYGLSTAHLIVDGIIFSQIMWAADLTPDWAKNASLIAGLLDSGAFGKITPAVLSILSRTLRAGRDSYGSLETEDNQYTAHFAALLSPHALKMNFSPELEQCTWGGNAESFITAADNVCHDRCIFLTTGGHFGIGPRDIAVADMVSVLGGANMPIVLSRRLLARERSVEGHGLDEYMVRGECYIDDIIQGAVIEAAEKRETHKGPFDPALLMAKLHDTSALASDSQEEYEAMKEEILERTERMFEHLKVKPIDIR